MDDSSPLEARAYFLKNWTWEFIVDLNRGACVRGGGQHGLNSEAAAKCADRWEEARKTEMSLYETVEFLRSCHRSQPFLLFNGNIFAELGRKLVDVLFAEVTANRRREITSSVAHFIAGVLDRTAMIGIVDGMMKRIDFAVGDHVRSLRGSLRGVIVAIEGDNIRVRSDGSGALLYCAADSLVKDPNFPENGGS